MKLALLPALRIQRELLELPPGKARFDRYLAAMLDGNSVRLPLQSFNPMSKAHVAELLDHLLASGAEAVAADALREAEARLTASPLELHFCLVVVDDLKGGWTHRHFNDMGHRFDGAADAGRSFLTGFLWSSEKADSLDVREETLACAYRAAHAARFGWPSSLAERLLQEARTLRFAAARGPLLEPEDLDYSRGVLAPHLSSTHPPVVFTCLYGDSAARSVGYPPLGLSAWAGLAVARADGLAAPEPPERALAG
ncbi:MAG TPA: hypothetical protein VIZ31_11965 [Vicinamibacteria bacterium]